MVWMSRSPPGAFLHVRLELVAGVVVLGVALLLFRELGPVELGHRPDLVGRERRVHRAEQGLVAGQQAGLEQRRHDRDVAGGGPRAVRRGAHARADFEAHVPEEG
jgi:hypothetical protein